MLAERAASRTVLVEIVLSSFILLGCAGDKDKPVAPVNDPPTSCFAVAPASGTTETEYLFDASCCADAQDSTAALHVRWDWEDDTIWDTDWTVAKSAAHRYETEGRKVVRLQARDSQGLTGETSDTLEVGHANAAPLACFSIDPTPGTLASVFDADAQCSSDAEDSTGALQVRWDWDNDGAWDIDWTRVKSATFRYPTLGPKTIRLDVRDSEGLTDSLFRQVDVGIDYFGRVSVGRTPELMVPPELRANAAWFWHGTPAFSPDGKEVFFTRYTRRPAGDYHLLVGMRLEDGAWTAPQRASFSIPSARDNNPCFSATGDTLYFVSGRDQGFLFFVTRVGDEWTSPTPIPVPLPAGTTYGLQFSLARNRTLYADVDVSGPPITDIDIYRWPWLGDHYGAPERLSDAINTPDLELMPCIDPLERFLVYCSIRPSEGPHTRMYISRRRQDGAWSDPQTLASYIDGPTTEGWPTITPDGKYFVFCTDREAGGLGPEPFWVDLRVLDEGPGSF